jgi:hypothetical protein
MRHLQKQAVELCRDLRENGLNGLNFIVTSFGHPTDPADDDLGPEMAAAWDRDYCCVSLLAETDVWDVEFDHPYGQATIDFDAIKKDLREKFVEYFGEDVIAEMEKFYGWEPNIEGGDTEVYRRSSPWEDFEGNRYGRPVDPLCENL